MKLFSKLISQIYFSRHIRSILNLFFRVLKLEEYARLKNYIQNNKDKLIFALNCRDPYQFEHIKDIYFFLKNNKSFLILPIGTLKFFKSENKDKVLSLFDNQYGLRYGENYFSYLWFSKIKSDIFLDVSITSYADTQRGCTKILYAHGLASLGFSKDFSHIKYVKKYDYLFLTGPLQKEAILRAQKKFGVDLPEMIEIGFFRGDRLLEKSNKFDKRKYLGEVGIEDTFTVLFAPTWGEFSCVLNWLDKIISICVDLEINLMIKLHPIMINGSTKWETGGVDWEKRLFEISKNSLRIYDVSNYNIDDLYLVSDLLISDVSSSALEFMILGKPVIFLPADNYFKLFQDEGPIFSIRKNREVKNKEQLKQELLKKIPKSDNGVYSPTEIIYNPGKALNAFSGFLENRMLENRTSYENSPHQ